MGPRRLPDLPPYDPRLTPRLTSSSTIFALSRCESFFLWRRSFTVNAEGWVPSAICGQDRETKKIGWNYN